MLISVEVNILACELGIFSFKIGISLGFLALGMGQFTGTSYIKEKKRWSVEVCKARPVYYMYIEKSKSSFCFDLPK
jgi:hypothetical protein